jgi:AraC-like DNA-binding protein
MRHSARVEASLAELVLHHHVNADGTLAFLIQRGQTVDLGYATYASFAGRMRQMYEAVMAAAANFMRGLCGPGWNPAMVFFPHSAPDDIAPYHQCFRAPTHFDAEFCALRFHASWLQHAVAGADSSALHAAHAAMAASSPLLHAEIARRALRTLMLNGATSGTYVADSLAMHRRTLSRRLAAEGTTFQHLFDEVRLGVARELLRESHLTSSAIGYALGFADEATFFRAFRRWTGTTPGAWRILAEQQEVACPAYRAGARN